MELPMESVMKFRQDEARHEQQRRRRNILARIKHGVQSSRLICGSHVTGRRSTVFGIGQRQRPLDDLDNKTEMNSRTEMKRRRISQELMTVADEHLSPWPAPPRMVGVCKSESANENPRVVMDMTSSESLMFTTPLPCRQCCPRTTHSSDRDVTASHAVSSYFTVDRIHNLKADVNDSIAVQAMLTYGGRSCDDQTLRLSSSNTGPADNGTIFVDHTFSLDLTTAAAASANDESYQGQRILLFVLANRNRRRTAIGCMSFGVSSLLSKLNRNKKNQTTVVRGWYYLLTERVGHQKHMRVKRDKEDKENVQPERVTPYKKTQPFVTPIRDLFSAQKARYDASSSNGFPSQSVGKTASERESNGESFVTAAADRLRTGHQLTSPGETDFSDWVNTRLTEAIHPSASTTGHVTHTVTQCLEHTGIQPQLHSDTGYCSWQSGGDLTGNAKRGERTDLADESCGYGAYSTGECSTLNDARLDSHIYDELKDFFSPQPQSVSSCGSRNRKSSDVNNNNNNNTNTTANNYRCRWYDVNDDVTALLTASPIKTVSNDDCIDTRLDDCLYRLLSLEQQYVERMTLGIQSFSRPLRYHLFNNSGHSTIFQNVEKLATLSESHLTRLMTSSDDDLTPIPAEAQISATYFPRHVAFCEAYCLYWHGLPTALRALRQLLDDNRQLATYVKNVKSPVSIFDFLHSPIAYFRRLTAILYDVINCQSMQSEHCQRVQTVFQSCREILCVTSSAADQMSSVLR